MRLYPSLLLLFFAVPLAVTTYKVVSLDYPVGEFIPAVRYSVELTIGVEGYGDEVFVSAYLPSPDLRQSIADQQYSSGPFALDLSSEGENRVAVWSTSELRGHHKLQYSFTAEPSRLRYVFPPDLGLPVGYPRPSARHLSATPSIEVGDPLVERTLREIVPTEEVGVEEVLRAIHAYVRDQIRTAERPESLSAATVLRTGEASSAGKSRAFVALAREAGVSARVAGGLLLDEGRHQNVRYWAEAQLGGHWVPFDPYGGYFAELPAHYLKLFSGDLPLFRHSEGTNFQYAYRVARELVPKRQLLDRLRSAPLHLFNLPRALERVQISFELVQLLLLFPLGALFITVFRNVVGVRTFGTFLPVLIAAAFNQTGLFWGLFAFLTIILGSGLIRHGLDRLGLLHSPKMSIVFTGVVGLMITMMILGMQTGLAELARVTLFPVAILTVTTERFAMIQAEQGFREAARTLLASLVVVFFCYGLLTSAFLRSLFLAFPELLLVVIALDLCLGRWVGVRLLEFVRFRRLIAQEQGG
jgi:transglutaminase-like putative cysteine protease